MNEQTALGRRRWQGYPSGDKTALVVASLAQFSVAAMAWAALARRPQGEVHGPKWPRTLLIGVNVVDPIAYFPYGRVGTLGLADR